MPDFVFSIDLELGAGIDHFVGKARINPLIERKIFPKLLRLAKKHEIPLTIAVTGHLFLDKCKGHENMPKPSPSYYSGDWYKNDPESRYPKNKSWYAPDLIKEIKEAGHEIACHSFSHVPFNQCSKKVAEAEIKESVKAAKKLGIKMKSFIFPRNEVRYLDLLKDNCFTHFTSYPKARHFLIDFKAKGFSFNNPEKIKGLIEVPRTYFFYTAKKTEALKLGLLLSMAKQQDALFHLWCHGFNIKSPEYFNLLERIFQKVNKTGFDKKSLKEVTA